MQDVANQRDRTAERPEAVERLMANTRRGVLSRIWYDRDDGRGVAVRVVEPKMLVDGADGLLVFAFQLEPDRGVRHFMVTRISRVEADPGALLSQTNTFCTGDMLVIRSSGGASPWSPSAQEDGYRAYLAAVREVVSDLRVEAWEIEQVHAIRQERGLPKDAVRAAHASVFAEYLFAYARDHELDEDESDHLAALADGLAKLGWRPG